MKRKTINIYDENCQIVEDTEEEESDELLIDWDGASCSSDDGIQVECCLRKEISHPGGLAFRIIGNRSAGIFITYVDPNSHQAESLKIGDRIVACDGLSFKGISCGQAASVLRTALSHRCLLSLLLYRSPSAPSLLYLRSTQSHLSLQLELDYRNRQEFLTPVYSNPTTTHSLRQSQSHSFFSDSDHSPSKKRNLRVMPSRSLGYLKNIKDDGDERKLLMENEEHQMTPEIPRRRGMNTFHSFDTASDIVEKTRCPICHRETKMRGLHIFSHRWLGSALRFFPSSRSEGSFPSTVVL